MLAHFLVNAIQYLDALENALPDFHIVFMFQLSRPLGFYPRNNLTNERLFFNLASGQFISFLQDADIVLDEKTSLLWHRYMLADFQSLNNEDFNGSQRKLILDTMVRFYKFHVEGMGEIRSLEVLHSYFHN